MLVLYSVIFMTIQSTQGCSSKITHGKITSGVYIETRLKSSSSCERLCWYSSSCRSSSWDTSTGLCHLSKDTKDTNPASFSVSRHHIYTDGISTHFLNADHPCSRRPSGEREVCVPVAKSQKYFPAGECRPGWMASALSCYWFSDKKRSFTGAVEICKDLGSQLATIQVRAEDDFIRAKAMQDARGSYWIGGSDESVEGSWTWVNGSPFNYTNWSNREPNNNGGGEDCATLNHQKSYKWNDDACSKKYYFVCETYQRI